MRKSEAMRMPKPRVGSAWKDLRSGQVWVMTGTRHNAPCLAKPGSKKSHRIAAHDLHMFYEPL